MGIFKPTWKKVIISFVILAILTLLSYLPISPLTYIYYSIPFAGIIILLLTSIIPGFYIGETDKLFKGILLALVLLIVATIATVYITEKIYNPILGHSCNTNSDCKRVGCFGTAVSKQYVEWGFFGMTCPLSIPSAIICENNECKNIKYEKIESVNFCEKLDNSDKEICYREFAFQLNDTSLCEKITVSSFCYEGLAIKLKDKAICEKIQDNTNRARCVINVNKS